MNLKNKQKKGSKINKKNINILKKTLTKTILKLSSKLKKI